MNCEEFQQLRHAAIDGELDAARAADVESHLRQCAKCSTAFENLKRMKSAFAATGLYYHAPPSLEERIRADLPARAPKPSAPPPAISWLWLKWLTSLGATAVAAVFLTATLLGNSSTQQFVGEISSSHVRALMPGHLMDVVSTDQHTVKPWFDGKVDFAPPVVDLAGDGFPLTGGRLDYLEGRTVAALVYQRNKHVINLFIWPAKQNESGAEKTFVRNGYNLVHWHQGGMTCWAVSDLNAVELGDFARLFENRTVAPGK